MMFTKGHLALIENGTKTQTRRAWVKPRVKIGRYYPIQIDYRTKAKGYIRVTGLRQEFLRQITESDAKAEGGYTVASYMEIWIKINGSWNPNQFVYVVDFEYVGVARPLAPGGGQ